MFVTMPAFANPMPEALMQPGGRSWRAVELAVRSPWFIVTLIERDQDEALATDYLLSSEEDLTVLVKTRAADLAAIQYVEPPAENPESRWRTRSVRRLWMSPGEGRSALVFEDDSGEFRSRRSSHRESACPQRTLLLDLSAKAS